MSQSTNGPPQHDLSDGTAPSLRFPARPLYTKRGKITIVACVDCRRRKTKCDGDRPVCGQCYARNGQCSYDMTGDQRRLTFLRDNVEQLHKEKDTLRILITNLGVRSQEEAMGILSQLREGVAPETLVQDIQTGRILAPGSRTGTESSSTLSRHQHANVNEQLLAFITSATPEELDEIIRRLRLHEDAGSLLIAVQLGTLLRPLEASGIYSQQEQRFGLMRAAIKPEQREAMLHGVPPAQPTITIEGDPSTSWTKVTNDQEIIKHVIKLYFSWQHCFLQSFPQPQFMQDFQSGNTQYCSTFLVNAICSAGSLLAPQESLPRGSPSPIELSRVFLEEAISELALIDISSMPTVAGLIIISHVEGNRGQMHRAWAHCGRSMRMALDLNLQQNDYRNPVADEATRCRNHVFWGCFIADQLISFTLGRIPQLPSSAIKIDPPHIIQQQDEAPWEPYGDSARTRRPGARSTTFYEIASLSKMLNSTLYLFFAHTRGIQRSLLLEEYSKYQSWYEELPLNVSLVDESTPHVLTLHMYYHAIVLLLFRPFLNATFPGSEVSPGEVCRSSAAAISRIFDQHCRVYESVGIYSLQVHCLLTACTIHILDIHAVISTNFFTSACNHFHRLEQGSTSGSLEILEELIQKCNIELPMEAQVALYRHKSLPHDHPRHGDFSAPSQQMVATARLPIHQPASAAHEASILSNGYTSSASMPSTEGRANVFLPPSTLQAGFGFMPPSNPSGQPAGPLHTSSALDMIGSEGYSVDGLGRPRFDANSGWFDPFMGYEIFGNYSVGGEGSQR